MRARRPLRWLKWLAAIIVILPLAGIAAGYALWTRSLPQVSGSIAMPGLGTEARVIRDRFGVPHIFAASMNDAMRVLGYLHAQDRLFQMDITRRVSQGRLAAIIGPDGLRFDRLFRTLDLAGHARNSLPALSEDARAQLDAYAAGVNAWLGEGHALPLEYTVLGFAPEPWKAEDSLLWGKAMAWKLSGNWRQDALRGRLSARYDRDRVERLFPKPFPEWPVTIEPRLGGVSTRADAGVTPRGLERDIAEAAERFAELLALPVVGHGASNEWVVDGRHSTTGKPLLANDPHLELSIPIIWYLARITTPELTLAGATAPGVPAVVLGQNGYIAWGLTTTESDTQDLFVETLDPKQPDQYLTAEGPKPMLEEKLQIEVKGTPPVPLVRQVTHHGPVVSGITSEIRDEGKPVTLAWTGFGDADTTAEALFRINRAKNRDEFLAALRLYQSPAQNLVFAAADGTIGFVNAGAVPVRKSGDGRYPADGASGAADWTGQVPFEGWPQLFDPPAGAIVNANNMVAPLDSPYWLGYDQGPGFRAKRILELLGERGHHDIASFSAIQMDIQAVHARDLVPYLLKLQPSTPLGAQALELLGKWDFSAAHDRPEPLIFDWWVRRMNIRLLRSGLDALAPTVGVLNAAAVIDILRRPDGFCSAEAGSDCMRAVEDAFTETLGELAKRYGPDVSRWRWGDEHRALIENQVMDRVPGFKALFSVDFPSDGGFYSINRGGNTGPVDPEHPLRRNSGAGFRGIYDLADPTQSRFIVATGESGHPLSPHYADQLPLWRRGEGIRLAVSEAELMAEGGQVLSFHPR